MQVIDPASHPVRYKRIILKLSGEVLRNPETGEPIDPRILEGICRQVKEVAELGVEIGIVIGGGNIFRGLTGQEVRGVDRTTGDYMGMLSTVINGLAFMDCLEKMGVTTRVMTSIPMDQVAEPFILRRATRHLEKKRVVIFVAGTGNPYFSTDTTAALRASEIQAEVIMKATKVDGVYDDDPVRNPQACRFDRLTYDQVLEMKLGVMDLTAICLCRDHAMPLRVFRMDKPGALLSIVMGEDEGTLIEADNA